MEGGPKTTGADKASSSLTLLVSLLGTRRQREPTSDGKAEVKPGEENRKLPGQVTTLSSINEILSLGEKKHLELSIRNPYPYDGQLIVTVDTGEVSPPAQAQTASFTHHGGFGHADFTWEDLAALVHRHKEEGKKQTLEESKKNEKETDRPNAGEEEESRDVQDSPFVVRPSSQANRRQQEREDQRPLSTSGASNSYSPFRPFSSSSFSRVNSAYSSESLSFSPWSSEDSSSSDSSYSAFPSSRRRVAEKKSITEVAEEVERNEEAVEDDDIRQDAGDTEGEEGAAQSEEEQEPETSKTHEEESLCTEEGYSTETEKSAPGRRTQQRSSATTNSGDETDWDVRERAGGKPSGEFGTSSPSKHKRPPISVARTDLPPRLVIKLKEGTRALEFERRTREFQRQKWVDQGFVEPNTYGDTSVAAGVSVTVDDPYEIQKHLRGFFSFNEQQAELVSSLSHLKQLDLLVLDIEESRRLYSSDTTKLKDAFSQVSDVEFVEFDEVVYALEIIPNDQLFSLQWNLFYPRNRMVDVNAPQAWEVVDEVLREKREREGLRREDEDWKGRVVAVIDTGVNYLHPDLKNQMWVNVKELYGVPGVDDDGNGYVDDVYGYDFVNDHGDPMDRDGHGTHCAGIIGAQANNGLGIAGINSRTRIMALKFMEGETGYVSDAARSLDYAIQNGASISSNSWGNAARLPRTMIEAVHRSAEKNMLFVTASGNAGGIDSTSENRDENRFGRDLDEEPLYPAALANSNVLTVGAVGQSGELASFSHFGKKTVDLAAPGMNIFSTWLLDSYEYKDGTSQACPLVAGVASLLWTMKPEASVEEIRRILIASSKRLPTIQNTIAHGLVDAYAAVVTLQETLGQWITVHAPSTLSPRSTATVSLDIRGKQNGFYRSQLRLLANYQGTPLNLAIVPIRLQVAESPILEFPPVIVLDPVLRNVNSLPVALPVRVPTDQGAVLVKVLKIDATAADTFFHLSPPGGEVRIENGRFLSPIKVGCRMLSPGTEDGILTLRARLADASPSSSPSSSSSSSSSSPSSSEPVERLYTVRLRCVAIDVGVAPVFLDLTVPPDSEVMQEFSIEKGERLLQREVRYSVEFVSVVEQSEEGKKNFRGARETGVERLRGSDSKFDSGGSAPTRNSGGNMSDWAWNRESERIPGQNRSGEEDSNEALGDAGYAYLINGADPPPGLPPVKYQWCENQTVKHWKRLFLVGREARRRAPRRVENELNAVSRKSPVK
ncbi:subtilisin SUB12 [Toxoplasma gondii ARI]|uniref:subtilisin n=1 Tax=Toxoplasma gondii ARI TaxID=1074872 RepID=A0A139XV36_TOXGO|nr:subtilisin SUB12 [Toxoplasma gondii ARI]